MVEFPVLKSQYSELLIEKELGRVYDFDVQRYNLKSFIRGHVMDYLETHETSYYLRAERIYANYDRKIWEALGKPDYEMIRGDGEYNREVVTTCRIQVYLGFEDPKDAMIFRLSI